MAAPQDVPVLAGYESIVSALEDYLLYPLRRFPSFFCGGLLLVGSRGTGKTTVIQAIAQQHGLNRVEVSIPATIKDIRNGFRRAIALAPAVLVLDNLDKFCPINGRKPTNVVKLIKSEMKRNTTPISNLAVVATTSRLHAIHPLVFESGLFEYKINMPEINNEDREAILNMCLGDRALEDPNFLNEAASLCKYYTGRDLKLLCQVAEELAINRNPQNVIIRIDDFTAAKLFVDDVLTNQIFFNPNDAIPWGDIRGLDRIKKMVRDEILNTIGGQPIYVRPKIRGVLLFGPSGCGKATMVKAIAQEMEFPLLNLSPYDGLHPACAKDKIIEIFHAARIRYPSIILIEDIDKFFPKRLSTRNSDIFMAFTHEMTRSQSSRDVILFATTNQPGEMNESLHSPDSYFQYVYVPEPNMQSRRSILQFIASSAGPLDDDLNLDQIANATQFFSSRMLQQLCTDAWLEANEEHDNISDVHFFNAINNTAQRLTIEEVDACSDFARINRFVGVDVGD